MQRYPQSVIIQAQQLRSSGKTYFEIKQELGMLIPKSTLSGWCTKVKLPPNYQEKIKQLSSQNLHRGRLLALVSNKIKREKFFQESSKINLPISLKVHDRNVAKIALSMLCLGEATKSKGGAKSLSLGNSDPRIVKLFIVLLKKCFDSFSTEKVRCTVQCRADQNIEELENFWISTTGIPKRLFYKARIDPRTIGKPTKKKNYKGVLRVDYFDSKIWHELETLADLVYNQVVLNTGL